MSSINLPTVTLGTFLVWFSEWTNGMSTVIDDNNSLQVTLHCRVENQNFEAIWSQDRARIKSLVEFPDQTLKPLYYYPESIIDTLNWVDCIADNTYPDNVIAHGMSEELRQPIYHQWN